MRFAVQACVCVCVCVSTRVCESSSNAVSPYLSAGGRACRALLDSGLSDQHAPLEAPAPVEGEKTARLVTSCPPESLHQSDRRAFVRTHRCSMFASCKNVQSIVFYDAPQKRLKRSLSLPSLFFSFSLHQPSSLSLSLSPSVPVFVSASLLFNQNHWGGWRVCRKVQLIPNSPQFPLSLFISLLLSFPSRFLLSNFLF